MLDTSPTKVIQIGDNAHNRVAQACDRCRRKKIRCDGKRPCCTQCANVGFECVTSDKLSRRAFPRGYTESLEAKVRSLQGELRQFRQIAEKSSNGRLIVATSEAKDQSSEEERTGTWPLKSIPEIRESSPLDNAGRSPLRGSLSMMSASPTVEMKPSRYQGLSSIGGLVDVLKYQHKGNIRPGPGPNLSTSRSASNRLQEDLTAQPAADWGTLPSGIQGELIDRYFQEWNPLFPILDRTDVETYCEGTSIAHKARQNKERLVLKHLVLSVGSLSGDKRAQRDSFPHELLWRDTLSSMMGSYELLTLQCLLLAQLFCIHKSDTAGLLHYQNLAIAMVFRLALHLSQSHESISVVDRELRRRLFWTQYTIHCFSAACLGQGVLIDEEDIRCEYPSTAEVRDYGDDVSREDRINGSAETNPSLALFKLARTLSHILRENYSILGPYSETRTGSMSTAEELSLWFSDFKTEFRYDGILGNVTNRNTLILRTTYNYVCTLLRRPNMIYCGEADQSSTSIFGESCKTLAHDLRQLEQNNMVFAMCIRSEDLLLLAGIGLLMQQSSPLASRTSKLESQAHIKAISEILHTGGSQGASELSYLIELVKPRSSLKRNKFSATQEDRKEEQVNGRNKIRKTQKAINTITSFDTPEITTPIKVEHAVSNSYTNNLDTKSPLKPTMRRISTVQSEPSYSPIRSSPVKRIPRNARHGTKQSYDFDLSSNTCSSQPVQSLIRAPPLEVDSLRVDVSAAQWARAGSYVATPPDHSPAAMSASFNHSHGYSFYNNTYENNPTSVPHTDTLPFNGNDNFANSDANIHPNSHIHIQHSNVNNANAPNVDVALMTPTDDFDPSWNTPSSVWDGSPAQSQIPISTMTSNCCNNINSPHRGTEMNMNACMNNFYTSHQVEQQQTQNSHHHHPHHSHHPPHHQQNHHALVDVPDEYSQTGNYVHVPTVLPAGEVVAADPTYQQSMMMAAAAAGAYGHLHTPP